MANAIGGCEYGRRTAAEPSAWDRRRAQARATPRASRPRFVDSANPIRTVDGGGLPWMITAGTGSLTRDGHLQIHVRGLVLADQSPVPPGMQGTNPVADFEAIVSCQSIGSGSQTTGAGAGGTATIINVSTGVFPASAAGNADIKATVKLPHPCIAPIVFVASPSGAWFAATGS